MAPALTGPYRQYNFSLSADASTFNVQWDDYWHDRFENADFTVSSIPKMLSAAFGIPTYGRGRISTAAVGAIAPSLLGITVGYTYPDSEVTHPGRAAAMSITPQPAQFSVAVDISRRQQVFWDYALGVNPSPVMTAIGGPLQLRFPGDYRRPANAPVTGMLTDDELLAVNTVAGSLGLPGLQFLAILVVLTGARRNAYHPAGYYGVSNLSAAQLSAVGVGVTAFVNMSVRGQLAATARYLRGLTPTVNGVLPVFFTLATGAPQPLVTPATELPVGGVTMTGGDATQLINAAVRDVRNEFTVRLPASVSAL